MISRVENGEFGERGGILSRRYSFVWVQIECFLNLEMGQSCVRMRSNQKN